LKHLLKKRNNAFLKSEKVKYVFSNTTSNPLGSFLLVPQLQLSLTIVCRARLYITFILTYLLTQLNLKYK